MSNSRSYNGFRNFTFGFFSRLISIVFPFISRTFILQYFDINCLGVTSLFSSLLSVMNLAELGFSSSIAVSLYRPIAEKDTFKICALMNLFKRVYWTIGLFLLIIGFCLTPFLSYIIDASGFDNVNIYLLWIIYLSNTVLSYYLFSYNVTILNASQRSDICEKIGTIVGLIINIFKIVTLILLKNIYIYASLEIVNSFIYSYLCKVYSEKLYPEYRCRGNIGNEEKKQIFKNCFNLSCQKIGLTLSNSIDNIVISSFIGLNVVAIYGNYNYVVTAITYFINLIFSSILAGVGNSNVIETSEKNYRDFIDISYSNIVILMITSVCFLALFQEFIMLWVGNQYIMSYEIVVLFVLRYFIDFLRKPISLYKDALGLWGVDRLRPIVGGVVNAILSIILSGYIGVSGVILGTIVSLAFIEIPWELYGLFKLGFKKSTISWYIFNIKTIIFLSPFAIIIICLSSFITANTIISFLIKSIFVFVSSCITFFLITKNSKSTMRILGIIKGFLN